eukprot:TRINITY_DN3756_c0_g1_i2.p1 TRINITY_DN3756_c0_g1~~TRINITY_DN3756_c0_g1_i2.p1  ORF type:complete len:482 (-),score=130.90 TRINITY_DN3756_c0_g1_i2:617-2062(-)
MASGGRLSGFVFALAGLQSLPEEVVRKVISEAGGLVDTSLSPQTTHVLTTDEMIAVWSNSYKLQFFPDFEAVVRGALVRGIPVVSFRFVEAQVASAWPIDCAPYVVFSAADIEHQATLDERVQALVNLIFDRNSFQKSIADLGFLPSAVERITPTDISKAYAILSEAEVELARKKVKTLQQAADLSLVNCSRRFYELIPLANMATIDSEPIMKRLLSTLETLSDILVASKALSASSRPTDNTVDARYRSLRTTIRPLETWMREYDVIKSATEGGRASMPADLDIPLQQIYEIERADEMERFAPFQSRPHHRLLWHGSRLANYVGILKNGLRIAPPEAPVTGYFLGKGVYFADMLSKSIEYCSPTKDSPHVLLMLCQVYLGRMYQTSHTKALSKEYLDEFDFQSVKGCGEFAPDPAYDVEATPGVLISLGRETSSGVTRSELKHNEYVVYDVAQVRIKYLVQLKVTSTSGRDIKAMSLVRAN